MRATGPAGRAAALRGPSEIVAEEERDLYFYQMIQRYARKEQKQQKEFASPGLIMLEIDGLSEPILKQALAEGRMPFFKKLLHRAFLNAKRRCDKWGDYDMHVAPYRKDQPIYYEFTACPTAEFAKKHGLLEVMPALCNPDFEGMEFLHAKLVRKTTCSNGCRCDYTICGDQDAYLKDHPEYRDEAGYRRNR